MPFDEDDKDDSVWFLDHDYLEHMYGMFKKVNGEIACEQALHFIELLCSVESTFIEHDIIY